MNRAEIVKKVVTPEWDKATEEHDWRNHVPEDVRKSWNTFSITHRILLYEWADQLAREEGDRCLQSEWSSY